jgi:hypothetical protein
MLFFGLSVIVGFIPASSIIVAYEIDEQSSLYIEGSSNVNRFDCALKDQFSKAEAHVTFAEGGRIMLFDMATLTLRTAGLDCDNEMMNEDLLKTMKADQYPYITVSLKSAKVIEGSLDNIGESARLKAEALFTITHVRRTVILDVKAWRMSENQFRFTSSASLRMTDYDIEPPSVLFGLIKVRDKISLKFDLITKTLN